MASSTSSAVLMTSVGPKVSSATAGLSSGTSTSTTGSMKGGRTASAPPDECRRATLKRGADVPADDLDLARA